MRFRVVLISLLILVIVGCDEDNPPPVSLFAENFLNEMINIMKTNSINRKTIDWGDFRTKVFAKASGAETLTEIYPAITEALTLLGDNHSVFFGPTGNTISVHTIRCNVQTTAIPTLPYNIGYVKVDQFGKAIDSPEAVAYAQEIQEQIESQDNSDVIGWIVDLRGNLGGNMWPMIAGIGPILGGGIAGYFIDPDNVEYSWGYQNGASLSEGNVVVQVPDPYELLVPNPKVAVLLDNGIASSGEVVAISFRGREMTKSFGSPTCGLSTANSTFTLSGNCKLALTVAYLADRNKNLFGMPIPPDQASTNESIVQDAVEWITQ